jgi:hypothetical protein
VPEKGFVMIVLITDFDERTITFTKNGQETTLTWGELNFLKHYRTEALKAAQDK